MLLGVTFLSIIINHDNSKYYIIVITAGNIGNVGNIGNSGNAGNNGNSGWYCQSPLPLCTYFMHDILMPPMFYWLWGSMVSVQGLNCHGWDLKNFQWTNNSKLYDKYLG